MKKAYPIVEIVWIDAEADPSWKDEDEIKNEPVGETVVSLGFLIRKPTPKFPMYILAGTATCQEKPLFNNTMKIPKHWVKHVSIIKEEYVLYQTLPAPQS